MDLRKQYKQLSKELKALANSPERQAERHAKRHELFEILRRMEQRGQLRAQKKATEQKTTSINPPVATLEVGRKARLQHVHGNVLQEIKELLRLPNPQYQSLVRHGKGGHRFVPENLEFFQELPAGLDFPRGWTRKSLELLKQHGIKVQVNDHRRVLQPIQLSFRGVLRGYQQEAVKQALRRDFGVISAATGSGKTIIALALIAERGQPCLVLVHNKELLYQWGDKIKEFLEIEPGLIGDGRHDLQPVTVAIVNSARKHLDSLPQHFGHIIVDECHRVPSTMFTETVQAFDSKYMLGLSATAYRRDGLDDLIFWTLGPKVHEVDGNKLTQSGAVMTPTLFVQLTSFCYNYNNDYSRMLSALTKDEKRNQQIANDVIQMANSRPGTALVVSDRVEHCKVIGEKIQAGGVRVSVLTGKTPRAERERITTQVQEGQIDVLCSTLQLLGEGFDCSGLSSLFLATPIKFKGRLLQVVGRILRPAGGKRPFIVDYLDPRIGVLKAQGRARHNELKKLTK